MQKKKKKKMDLEYIIFFQDSLYQRKKKLYTIIWYLFLCFEPKRKKRRIIASPYKRTWTISKNPNPISFFFIGDLFSFCFEWTKSFYQPVTWEYSP